MSDLKDINHILIGYDRTKEYVINREILRYNFADGVDLWLTTVFNGDFLLATLGLSLFLSSLFSN